jgi:cell division protein FtsL
MGSGSLGMLIVGSIIAIGLIQLIVWIVVVLTNPNPLVITQHRDEQTIAEQPAPI